MADLTRPPRRSALIAEGSASAVAARAASTLRILLAFVLGSAVTFITATTVTNAAHAAADQVLAGRNTLRVIGAASGPITAGSCDSLEAMAGVRHAGGLRSAGTGVLANGIDAPRFTVTQGFVGFLEGDAPAPVAPVAVGPSLAARAGLRTGTLATVDGSTPLRVTVLPTNRRTSDWAGALLVVGPPDGRVDECWVELDHAPTPSDDQLLVLVEGPRPLVIGPLDPAAVGPTPAETTVHTITPIRAGLGAALPLVLVTIAIWWARRGDWALYSVLGFGSSPITVMAAAEWVWCTGLPVAAGAAWGALAVAGHDRGTTSLPDGLRAAGTLLLASALSLGWLRASTSRMRTRRLLAGM